MIAVGSDLEVFTGAGNGTFTSTTSVTPAFPPEAVSVADIDGQDGNDLVTAYADGSVSSETAVYLNSVVNPFTTQALGSPYNLGQNEQDVIVEEVAVGDLNGDGVPDLAQVTQVTTSTAPVTITDPLVFVQLSDLGDGGTLFPTTTRYELAVDSTEIELCDFSADGLLDALLNGEQSNLTRLNSNAQGDLLPSTTPADSNDAVGVLTGDVNNDNREDVVTRDDENIFVYLRDASGVVPDSPDFTIDTGIVGGEVLRLADMNDDTFLDAVIGGNNSSEIVIFPNPGTGDFDETMTTTVTFTNSIDIFAVGLLNGDAFPDIVTDNNSGNGLQVALTNGELSYDASMLVAGSSEVRDLRLINLDADSELEVVTAQAVPGLGVYQNSAGTLSEDTVIPLDGNEVQQVEVGDLNGDGIADVVASGRLANFSEVYVLLNQQNGSLGISQTLSDARVDVIVDILVGDANNDGASDILLADADTGGIAVLTGSGDGTTFNNSLAHYFAGGDIRGESSLALSDLNGDGENEILVTTPASGALITLLTLFLLYCLRALRVRRHRVA